jgi:integrase
LSISDFLILQLHKSQIDGRPLLPDSITHAWMKIAGHSGLEGIRLHDAWHTHASLMLKQGVHPKIVQERPGYSRTKITIDTYSHVAPGLQQSAALFGEQIQREVVRLSLK